VAKNAVVHVGADMEGGIEAGGAEEKPAQQHQVKGNGLFSEGLQAGGLQPQGFAGMIGSDHNQGPVEVAPDDKDGEGSCSVLVVCFVHVFPSKTVWRSL